MNNKKTVAVVVGRFQVPSLHDGHRALLEEAENIADELIIVLGDHGGQPTAKNPLSFELREQLLKYESIGATIVGLKDMRSDEEWSRRLDKLVDEVAPGADKIMVGSRDSFIKVYSGKYPVKEIPELPNGETGSDVRASVRPDESEEFRAGVIWAHTSRFSVSYQTTDIAVVDFYNGKILLGRKPDSVVWQFIGGFVDPTDACLENAAKRELNEEVGVNLEVGQPQYVGSYRVDDVRYRGQPDQILTAFFMMPYVFGFPKAGDDIEEVRWFGLHEARSVIADFHQPLYRDLMKYLEQINKKKGT